MNKEIEKNFKSLKSGLWKCKFCGTTFKNENECNKHLEDLKKELEEMK